MSTYKFIKIKDNTNEFDLADIKFSVHTEQLTDLIQEFKMFLKACGFVFNDVDLVD